VSEELEKVLSNQVEEAKKAISKDKVDQKSPLTIKELREAMDCLRGAVMIAYPAYHGLPDWEPVKMVLENKFDWASFPQDIYDYLGDKETTMWWAGKELLRGKILSDYTGKNEKTKIVVKLQKSGGGPPVREPAIDQKSYVNMLSFYRKKEEEMKKLEEDNDDAYLNSAWANPKNLKSQLIGTGSNITWKPK